MGTQTTLSPEIIKCPSCKTSLRLTTAEREIGSTIECPSCKQSFINTASDNSLSKRILIGLGVLLLIAIALPRQDNSKDLQQNKGATVAGVHTIQATPTSIITVLPTTEIVTTTPAATTIIPTTIRPTAKVTSAPKPTAKPTTRITPRVTSKPRAQYTCDCSKTCTQIKTCAEAQYQLKSCGCKKRDADHDGIACDAAPLNCQH